LLERAVTEARSKGDPIALAEALVAHAVHSLQSGRVDEAVPHLEEAWGLVTTAANARGIAIVGLYIGQVQAVQGAPEIARRTLGQACDAADPDHPDLVQPIDAAIRALGADKEQVLTASDPLLQVAADAASGDAGAREAIEGALPDLETNGWRLTVPLRLIWDGERDADTLTADIDANSGRLVLDVLRRVSEAPAR
jgi:hypothetical protein